MSEKETPATKIDPWKILGEEVLFEAKPFVQVTRQHIITTDGRDPGLIETQEDKDRIGLF